ncbi:transglutaminase domain-containing protein [Psychroserpens sp.]|uniref:transglutaminase domain-containing protein n=1 Tax=Psychroserpens sp. TaxID=2020870 RepID=UPI00385CF4EF
MRCLLLFIVAFQSHAQRSDFRHINFQKSDSIAETCKNEGLENLPELAYKLTSNLSTDTERFRAIYKWVCNNIANDYSLYLRNKRKRERYKNDSIKLEAWNDRFKKEIFRKLLKQKKTICTGYAYIVQELSKLANLDCKIIHGFGKTSTINIETSDIPNHTWNAIKLDGKWYLCDPTWASGIPNQDTNVFSFEYNDGYFLADPNLFAINHYPLNNEWSLLDNRLSFEDFLAAPILYGKSYTHLIKHEKPKQMHHDVQKNDTLNFEFDLQKPIQKNSISFLIDSGFISRKVKPTFIQIENKSLSIRQQFNTKGFYDVHLYFGEDLISTYTVKVNTN